MWTILTFALVGPRSASASSMRCSFSRGVLLASPFFSQRRSWAHRWSGPRQLSPLPPPPPSEVVVHIKPAILETICTHIDEVYGSNVIPCTTLRTCCGPCGAPRGPYAHRHTVHGGVMGRFDFNPMDLHAPLTASGSATWLRQPAGSMPCCANPKLDLNAHSTRTPTLAEVIHLSYARRSTMGRKGRLTCRWDHRSLLQGGDPRYGFSPWFHRGRQRFATLCRSAGRAGSLAYVAYRVGVSAVPSMEFDMFRLLRRQW